jgi:hypothetical protein
MRILLTSLAGVNSIHHIVAYTGKGVVTLPPWLRAVDFAGFEQGVDNHEKFMRHCYNCFLLPTSRCHTALETGQAALALLDSCLGRLDQRRAQIAGAVADARVLALASTLMLTRRQSSPTARVCRIRKAALVGAQFSHDRLSYARANSWYRVNKRLSSPSAIGRLGCSDACLPSSPPVCPSAGGGVGRVPSIAWAMRSSKASICSSKTSSNARCWLIIKAWCASSVPRNACSSSTRLQRKRPLANSAWCSACRLAGWSDGG